MEGGEVIWKDEDDMPTLPIDRSRAIFRDIVNGLDYCKYILCQPQHCGTMLMTMLLSALSGNHTSRYQTGQFTCT